MISRNNETTIFLHIPKNGGTTTQSYVRKICAFSKQYHIEPNDVVGNTLKFSRLPREYKANLELVRGHIKFGLHQIIENDAKYISILRDPVDRTISQYFHAKRHPHHAHFKAINEKGLSLIDYIDPDSNFIKGYVLLNCCYTVYEYSY